MKVRWFSGPVGASWIAIDSALARLVEEAGSGIAIDVVPGGGRENIDALRAGDCDVATSIGFLAASAYRGLAPYRSESFTGLRTLALGWNEIPFHLIKAVDAPDNDFVEALHSPDARIGIPPESTSDELTFRQVLRLTGNTYSSVRSGGATLRHDDYDTLAHLFTTGSIDWIFGATAAPARVIEELSRARAAQLKPVEGILADQLTALGYTRTRFPRDTYPRLQQHDVETVAMTSTIVTTDRLPDDVARELITRLTSDPDRIRRIHPSLDRVARPPARPANGVPRHSALD